MQRTTVPVCDDNDCTNGLEIWSEATCTCETIPIDCSTGPISIVSCDDNDPNTIDDEQTILDCDGSICVPCAGDSVLTSAQLLPMDDAYEVIFGQVLSEDVSINDELEITQDISNNLILNPNSGTIEFNADGTFEYQAIDPLSNIDFFTYQICVTDCPEICAEADVSLTITLDDIIIPDAISPNGDGLNDTWIIPGLLERDIRKMTIINRWGSVLFKTDYYENDWNGNNKNGKPLPEGTYYYYLDMGVNFATRQGPITVIR